MRLLVSSRSLPELQLNRLLRTWYCQVSLVKDTQDAYIASDSILGDKVYNTSLGNNMMFQAAMCVAINIMMGLEGNKEAWYSDDDFGCHGIGYMYNGANQVPDGILERAEAITKAALPELNELAKQLIRSYCE